MSRDGKSITEIVLMPLVVALVGFWGTWMISERDERNATIRAASEREAKMVEIFANKITSSNKNEKIMALKLLEVMEPDLAKKLGEAVLESDMDAQVRAVASTAVEVAAARSMSRPRIYIHIQKEEQRKYARTLSQKLKKQGFLVPGIERISHTGPDVTEFRYFFEDEKDGADKIIGKMKNWDYECKSTYIAGYENSTTVKHGHFEIWIGRDVTTTTN